MSYHLTMPGLFYALYMCNSFHPPNIPHCDREVKDFTQGHVTFRGRTQDSHPSSAAPELRLVTGGPHVTSSCADVCAAVNTCGPADRQEERGQRAEGVWHVRRCRCTHSPWAPGTALARPQRTGRSGKGTAERRELGNGRNRVCRCFLKAEV